MMIHRQAMVLAVTAAVLVSVCQTMVSLIERQIVDGFALRSLDLLGYRRQPGYVPQQAVLFTGTIRDTTAHDRPEASNDEVETAARAVGAHEFIAELPGGYFH